MKTYHLKKDYLPYSFSYSHVIYLQIIEGTHAVRKYISKKCLTAKTFYLVTFPITRYLYLCIVFLCNMLNTFSCYTGGGLEPHKIDGSYRSVLKLAIRRVTSSDYGTYKCVSKNSLGDTEGTIKLYRKY